MSASTSGVVVYHRISLRSSGYLLIAPAIYHAADTTFDSDVVIELFVVIQLQVKCTVTAIPRTMVRSIAKSQLWYPPSCDTDSNPLL